MYWCSSKNCKFYLIVWESFCWNLGLHWIWHLVCWTHQDSHNQNFESHDSSYLVWRTAAHLWHIWGVLWLHIVEVPQGHHALHHQEAPQWHESSVTGLGLISGLFHTVKKCHHLKFQWLCSAGHTLFLCATGNHLHQTKGISEESVIKCSKIAMC